MLLAFVTEQHYATAGKQCEPWSDAGGWVWRMVADSLITCKERECLMPGDTGRRVLGSFFLLFPFVGKKAATTMVKGWACQEEASKTILCFFMQGSVGAVLCKD